MSIQSRYSCLFCLTVDNSFAIKVKHISQVEESYKISLDNRKTAMELPRSENMGLAMFNRRRRIFQAIERGEEPDRSEEEVVAEIGNPSQNDTVTSPEISTQTVTPVARPDVGLAMFNRRRQISEANTNGAQIHQEETVVAAQLHNQTSPPITENNNAHVPVVPPKPDLGLSMFNRRRQMYESNADSDQHHETVVDAQQKQTSSPVTVPVVPPRPPKPDLGLAMFNRRKQAMQASENQEETVVEATPFQSEIATPVEAEKDPPIPVKPDVGLAMFNRRKELVENL